MEFYINLVLARGSCKTRIALVVESRGFRHLLGVRVLLGGRAAEVVREDAANDQAAAKAETKPKAVCQVVVRVGARGRRRRDASTGQASPLLRGTTIVGEALAIDLVLAGKLVDPAVKHALQCVELGLHPVLRGRQGLRRNRLSKEGGIFTGARVGDLDVRSRVRLQLAPGQLVSGAHADPVQAAILDDGALVGEVLDRGEPQGADAVEDGHQVVLGHGAGHLHGQADAKQVVIVQRVLLRVGLVGDLLGAGGHEAVVALVRRDGARCDGDAPAMNLLGGSAGDAFGDGNLHLAGPLAVPRVGHADLGEEVRAGRDAGVGQESNVASSANDHKARESGAVEDTHDTCGESADSRRKRASCAGGSPKRRKQFVVQIGTGAVCIALRSVSSQVAVPDLPPLALCTSKRPYLRDAIPTRVGRERLQISPGPQLYGAFLGGCAARGGAKLAFPIGGEGSGSASLERMKMGSEECCEIGFWKSRVMAGIERKTFADAD
eukprot:scaffold2210_cov316-Pinguiococcus_pyrenoidosus.AAC.4